MVATALIKTDAEQQELLKQLFAADASGIHRLNYGLSASNFNNGKGKGFGDGGLLADLGAGTGLAQADLVLG